MIGPAYPTGGGDGGSGGVYDTPFTTLTLMNGFTFIPDSGSPLGLGYPIAQGRLQGDTVELVGNIIQTENEGNHLDAIELPVGWRPDRILIVPVPYLDTANGQMQAGVATIGTSQVDTSKVTVSFAAVNDGAPPSAGNSRYYFLNTRFTITDFAKA